MRPMCLSLSAVLLAALSSPATAQTPLLQPDTRATSTLDQYLAPATSRQGLRPSVLDRAANIDGSARQPITLDPSVHANPFESEFSTSIGHPDLRFDVGAYSPTEVDLSLPSRGVQWVIGRAYNPLQRDGTSHHDSNGPQGWNWSQLSTPELVVSADGATVYIVWGADRYSTFVKVSELGGAATDVFRGVNGTAGAVVFQAGGADPDTYLFTDQRGVSAAFFAPNTAAPGQIWYITDGAGHTAFAGSLTLSSAIVAGYGSDGLLDVVHDPAGRVYTYTYSATPIGGAKRLTSVVATSGTLGTTVVGSVEYSYYESDVPGAGLAGDLKTVATTLPLSDPNQTVTYRQHYRYWTEAWSAATPGHPHSVRMVIEAEGYRTAFGDAKDPNNTATSLVTLAPHASLQLSYAEDRRVAAYSAPSAGSNTAPGSPNLTVPTNAVAYATGSSGWASRATTTSAGVWITKYFDAYGQSLSTVRSSADPAGTADHWVNQVVRDASGRVSVVGTPESVTSYNHATGVVTGNGAGQTFAFSRVVEGTFDGFLAATARASGTNTATIAAVTYVGQSGEDPLPSLAVGSGPTYTIARPLIGTSTRFEDDAGTSPITTTYAYAAYPMVANLSSSLAIKQVTTTDPAVTTDRNGPGEAWQTLDYYSPDGLRTFHRSRSGRIHVYVYDPATGEVTNTYQDANTTLLTGMDIPGGYASSTASGVQLLHRHRWFSYDAQGRLAFSHGPNIADPAGMTAQNWTGVMADGRLVVLSIPRTTATPSSSAGASWYGPAAAGVYLHNGQKAGSLLIGLPQASALSAVVPVTSTAPAGWLTSSADILAAVTGPASAVRKGLQTTEFDPTGTFAVERRTYYNNPSSLPGAPSVNYFADSFGYAKGRLVKTIDATKTIETIAYDAIGRPVATGKTTQTSTGENPLHVTAEFKYDDGLPGGNSRLTSATKFPGGQASPRVTTFHYDWRDRLVGVINPAAPHAVVAYDNLDRVTAVASLGGAGFSGTPPHPEASDLPTRRSLTTMAYDQLGRVYERAQHEIDKSTGGRIVYFQGTATKYERTWYGKEGAPRRQQGDQDVYFERNRACEVTAVYVTLDADTGTTTWESATTAPADGAVVEQLAVVRDPTSGAVVAQAHGQRAGAAVGASEVYDPCAPDNTPIFPPGTFEPDGNGGFVIKNLPRTPTHPMQVDSYVYDHLGRPVQRTFWGDPAYRLNDGHAVPTGGTSPINGRTRQAVGSYPADAAERALVGGVYPRTQTTFLDSFGLPAVEASPAGRATEITYDGALRVLSTRPRLINVDLPPGFTGGSPTGTGDIVYLSCTDPPITREYDGILMKALLPGDEFYPCQAAAENLYEPDIRTIADPAFIPDVSDNRVPLGLRTNAPSGAACGGDDATWLIKKNALGELTKAKDPAGNIFNFVRDGGGKLTQLTVAPAGGGTTLVRQFDYDDRGVQVGVSETGGVPGGSSTSRIFDNWGNLKSFGESITSTGPTDPLRGFGPMTTCYFPQLNTDGWNRFENGASQYPGGFGERNVPIGPGENGCPNPRPKLGQNWAVEVYPVPGPVCTLEPEPPFLKLGIPYHGIADPSWFEVQPGSEVSLPSINDPKFLSMKVGLDDFGRLPTNAWGEPVRDNICAGILRPGTGPCSGDDALEDQSITRDADGRILDLTDNLVPFSGRRTIYMDCSRSLEQLEGRIESPYGAGGGAATQTGPANTTDTIIRTEAATYDRFGNVMGYGRSGPSVTSLNAQYTINAQNQVTEALIDSVAIEPVYDANGNLKEPGDGRRFAYDPFNNLTHVYQTNGGSEYLYARFWYNANGRRIAAAYNTDQDPGLTDAVFDDDRVEFFAYDDLWRLRAVYAREAGQADATCRERYAYNPAGMNGKPSSAPLDSPLFGQIDVAGDGTFERSFYIIQNTLGDVIKIVEAGGQHEEIRYTLYGEPYIVNWMADINQDGLVDGDDLISFFALWDVGAFGSDTNGDGGVDGDDVIQFLAWWDNGEGAGRTTEDNRFGFRGYVWDDRLQMYHVRHRVYDPMPGPAGMRWLQRDPAFFVDGLNLYAYCGGDPVNGVDPLGLEPEPPTKPATKKEPDIWTRLFFGTGSEELGRQVEAGRKQAADEAADMMKFYRGYSDTSQQRAIDQSALKQGFSQAYLMARDHVWDTATGGSVSGMMGSAKQITDGVVHAANHVDDVGGVWQAIKDLGSGAWQATSDCADGALAMLGASGFSKASKAPDASKIAELAKRVDEVHGKLDSVEKRYRTTAVLETADGRRVVGSGGRDLNRAQRGALLEGEIASKLPGEHAEITVLEEARKLGAQPGVLRTSRPFCDECRAAIEAAGGQLLGPQTAYFPK